MSRSSSRPAPAALPQNLGVGQMQLAGFYYCLDEAERQYIDSLQLGPPELLQDYFIITQVGDRISTKAVGVLYRNVFLLFRAYQANSLRAWDHSDSRHPPVPTREAYFVYGYLYPRHIHTITPNQVGTGIILG